MMSASVARRWIRQLLLLHGMQRAQLVAQFGSQFEVELIRCAFHLTAQRLLDLLMLPLQQQHALRILA